MVDRRVLTAPLRKARRYKARHALTQLATDEDPRLAAISGALLEAISDVMTPEERRLLAAIEHRRSRLLASDEEIDVVDYGAGTPTSARSREEMRRGVHAVVPVTTICRASKSRFWATVLFKLIRKLQPSSCVELGSCVGISAAYQATGLRLNGHGHLVTMEGSPEIAKIAQQSFEKLNLTNTSLVVGPFHAVLGRVLEDMRPVDYFFNDGHHDHHAVLEYFHDSLECLADGAVVVFDDIAWSKGMRRAWEDVENDEHVAASLDLRSLGVIVVEDNPTRKRKFKIPL